jgi:O-antigen ligase
MGFFLSVVYFFVTYLGTSALLGSLASLHIELIVACLALIVSLPSLPGSILLKTPQSLALVGLAAAVFLSVLMTGWLGGAVQAFLAFTPSAFAYCLICLHCNSKKRLQIIVLMLLFVCLFVIAHGCLDLHYGVSEVSAHQSETAASSYLLGQTNDAGEHFYRLMGQGFLHDPNDFAQMLVCVIPLVFIFWQERRIFANIICVILPACALLYGTYLTHSRGAILALTAMLAVAARRRIGWFFSLLLAGAIFALASVLHFSGGREISASSGSDRTDLWGAGLELLKTHPLFGVGFGRMAEYAGLTAHNSVVVCAAELGSIGLFCWSMFLFPTMRDTLAIASSEKVSEGMPIESEAGFFLHEVRQIEVVEKTEINRLGQLMTLSFTGFLIASWFLSRAYVMTLFLLGGMTEVVFEMALRRGMIGSRWRLERVLPGAVGLAISLILIMYVLLRVTNLTR